MARPSWLWIAAIFASLVACSGPQKRSTPKPSAAAAGRAPACAADMVAEVGGAFQLGMNDNDFPYPLFGAAAPIMKPRIDARAKPFCIDRLEVTVADYRACVSAGRCTPALDELPCNSGAADRDLHPINCVSWEQAVSYCNYRGKRLPTEKEWEFAARGAKGRLYPWGNINPLHAPNGDELLDMRETEDRKTRPVGTMPKAATPEGVQDLGGNVWEWTSSPACLHDHPGCNSEGERIGKAGGKSPLTVAAANRFFFPVATKSPELGFRCASDQGARPTVPSGAIAAQPAPIARETGGRQTAIPTVHWSQLAKRDELQPVVPPGTRFPRHKRVVCMVQVTLGTDGRATKSKAIASAECTPTFAAIAESAARAARWWITAYTETGVISTIPVIVAPPKEQEQRSS